VIRQQCISAPRAVDSSPFNCMHLQQFKQTIGSQKHATLAIIKDYKLKKNPNNIRVLRL